MVVGSAEGIVVAVLVLRRVTLTPTFLWNVER